MKLTFSSKAKTLEKLVGVLKNAEIPQTYSFTNKEWKSNKNNLLINIFSTIKSNKYIVRSSSAREDTNKGSKAGAFLSIPFVNQKDL